jgi:hypothetical protein
VSLLSRDLYLSWESTGVVVWDEWRAQVSWPQRLNGEALKDGAGTSRSETRKREEHAHTPHIVGWGLLAFYFLILGCTGASFQAGAAVAQSSVLVNFFFLVSSATIAPCCSYQPLFIGVFIQASESNTVCGH